MVKLVTKRGEISTNMLQNIYISPSDDFNTIVTNLQNDCIVHLSEGVFRGKFKLDASNVTIIGAGMDKTVIEYGDYAQKPHPDGREYNTFRTWTMAVCGDNVKMSNLTIKNYARYPEKLGQEVALTVYGDRFEMTDCRLTSTQDTLFCGPLPYDLTQRYIDMLPPELRRYEPMSQHFKRCLIEGTVDFIFGCGDAVFEDCEIRSLWDKRNVGYVCAPAHGLENKTGMEFRRCRFTADEGVSGIYLARPWRDYGIARFTDCEYGGHIAPEGFDKWNDTHRDETARFYETPIINKRVNWINKKEEN